MRTYFLFFNSAAANREKNIRALLKVAVQLFFFISGVCHSIEDTHTRAVSEIVYVADCCRPDQPSSSKERVVLVKHWSGAHIATANGDGAETKKLNFFKCIQCVCDVFLIWKRKTTLRDAKVHEMMKKKQQQQQHNTKKLKMRG